MRTVALVALGMLALFVTVDLVGVLATVGAGGIGAGELVRRVVILVVALAGMAGLVSADVPGEHGVVGLRQPV